MSSSSHPSQPPSCAAAESSVVMEYKLYEYSNDNNNNNNSDHRQPASSQCKEYQIRISETVNDIGSNDKRRSTGISSTSKTIEEATTTMKIESVPVVVVTTRRHGSSSVVSHPSPPPYITLTTLVRRFVYDTMMMIGPLVTILKQLVLPVNYPTSVRTGYLQYQMYDSIQGFSSYLRNIVCSAAVFAVVVGVEENNNGDSPSSSTSTSTSNTAWNAAILWAIRDGTGLMGGLVYTYMISSYLDAYVREFRFFADIINDIGFTLDMILPYIVPRTSMTFWMISSASVICKVMCGVSAGATKSSITHHFALDGNMADLNAKESTQETIVTLLGMVGGIYVAKLLQSIEQQNGSSSTGSQTVTWIFFVVLTAVHLYSNYLGVSLLQLRTVNKSRIDPCFLSQEVVSEMDNDTNENSSASGGSILSQLLLSIRQHQKRQQLQHPFATSITDFFTDIAHHQLLYGAEIRTLLPTVIKSPDEIQEMMFLPIWQWFGFTTSSSSNDIYCNTTPYRQLQPYFHQSLLGHLLLLLQQQQPAAAATEWDMLSSTLRYNITILGAPSTSKKNRKCTNKVAITLFTGATSNDELQAYIHAKFVIYLLQQQDVNDDDATTTSNGTISRGVRQVLLESFWITQLLFQIPSQNNTGATTKSTKSSTSTTGSGMVETSPPPLPLFVLLLQQKDWDVTRFYFNYPSSRCQLVVSTSNDSSVDNVPVSTTNNKKDD